MALVARDSVVLAEFSFVDLQLAYRNQLATVVWTPDMSVLALGLHMPHNVFVLKVCPLAAQRTSELSLVQGSLPAFAGCDYSR